MSQLLFGNASTCTYCGEPAEEVDHVIAYSFQTILRVRLFGKRFGPLTYSCRECNHHLTNRYFDTFADRCRFASNRLSPKPSPEAWTEEELSALDPSLAAFIRRNNCRYQLRRIRASWFESRDYLLNIENLEWLQLPKKFAAYFSETLKALKLLGDSWKPTFSSIACEDKNSSGTILERSEANLRRGQQ